MLINACGLATPVVALLALLASTFQTRAAQQAEIAALRHQIAVLQRGLPRRLRPQAARPAALDSVVALVARLATLRVYRESRHSYSLAPHGLRPLVDIEVAVVPEDQRWLPRFAT
jgi:hypothetical protein